MAASNSAGQLAEVIRAEADDILQRTAEVTGQHIAQSGASGPYLLSGASVTRRLPRSLPELLTFVFDQPILGEPREERPVGDAAYRIPSGSRGGCISRRGC